ncbi:MAG TPA: DUF3943 domain-containing protein [Prolixibacteraceae bacterium]|nr:DUF3943 domain-containing protein [Prolixibacteraceae bacterium]HPS12455.1 DUF3943 domain-containing protein [Prolixibacteraceae bacterium]
MKRFSIILLLILLHPLLHGQTITAKAMVDSIDNPTIVPDTLKSFLVRNDPPFLFSANLNHRERTFGNKILRGSLYSIGYNTVILTALVFAPESLSKWENKEEKFSKSSILHQYKNAYTKPPVIDKDLWTTNYLGHPYQGAFYYNSVRSQGAKFWQASLFAWGQAVLWEYGWEAGIEQPSIQDLLTTPLCGILVGETFNLATLAMSRHGFTWYEIAAVCVINPAYAINNQFKFNKRILPKD